MDISIKPLTVNKAWQGRRYKTNDYLQYEQDVLMCLLPYKSQRISGWVNIRYELYIKNYKMSDVGNFEKPLSDIIVKAGLIDDDRFIKKIEMEKFKSDQEHIKIFISKADEE